MRKPDLTIGPEHDPQTLRWHLLRWRGVQVALHRWLRSDGDRALHDHSADNISVLLTGRYTEHLSHAWQQPNVWPPSGYKKPRVRYPFVPYFRKAETPHRIVLTHGPVWTLWVRFPPRREWGFWCPKGWTNWRKMLGDYANGGVSTMRKGCDD